MIFNRTQVGSQASYGVFRKSYLRFASSRSLPANQIEKRGRGRNIAGERERPDWISPRSSSFCTLCRTADNYSAANWVTSRPKCPMNIHILARAILRASLSSPLLSSLSSCPFRLAAARGKKKLSRVKNVMKLENYVRSSFRANATNFRFRFFPSFPCRNLVASPPL